jgi:membrane associated rhomboid family serine protease
MIPLRDTIPSARFPFVNVTLILLNGVCFLYELSLGPDLSRFIYAFGLVPARLHTLSVAGLGVLLSSMFLHSGVLHLLGNMLFLYIFGDNVEDRLGHARYLIFYLLSGAAAGVAQAYALPTSTYPMIGASGAIAGVTGAYFLFFPTARVVTLVPIFFFFQIVEIPAVVFLLFWFVMQILYGLVTVSAAGRVAGGVAWWAHIGGFVFGMIVAPLLARTTSRRRMPPADLPWGD